MNERGGDGEDWGQYGRDLGSDVDLGQALRDHHRWLILGVIFYVYYAAYMATAIRNILLRLPPPAIFSGADLLAGAWFVGLAITFISFGVIEVAFSGFAVARRTCRAFSACEKVPDTQRSKAGFGVGLGLMILGVAIPILQWAVGSNTHGVWGVLFGFPGSFASILGGAAVMSRQKLWGHRYGLMLLQAYPLALLVGGKTLRGGLVYLGIGSFLVLTFVWWARELAVAKGLSHSHVYEESSGEGARMRLAEMRANTLFVLIASLVLLPAASGRIVAARVQTADPIWGLWTQIEGSRSVVRIARELGSQESEGITQEKGEAGQREYWFFGTWNNYVLGVDRESRDIWFVQLGYWEDGRRDSVTVPSVEVGQDTLPAEPDSG